MATAATSEPREVRVVRVVPPALHPGQHDVRRAPQRFRVLACGRRWGKTRLGAILCIDAACNRGRAWWVAPTFAIAEIGWRTIKGLALQLGAKVEESHKRATFPGGGSVQVKSADNPDTLRGEGLDFLVIDEAAYIDEAAWTDALRPSLSDRKGRAMLVSTPSGFNWFYRAFRMADEEPSTWHSWQLPTVSNPFIDPMEVEAARRDISDATFRQEYLAEFTAQTGRVFGDFSRSRHVRSVSIEPNLPVSIGIDFGYRTFAMIATQIDKRGAVRVIGDGEWNDVRTVDACERIKRFPWAARVETIACDPAGDAVNLQSGLADVALLRAAFPSAKVTFSTRPDHRSPEWRAARVRDLLWSAAEESRFVVDAKCTGTIRMLEQSVYPESKSGRPEKAEPTKDGTNDHLRDALGYLVVNVLHSPRAAWV